MDKEDIENAAKTIRKSIKDGLVPQPIFNAISQVTVLSPIDLYAFIREGNTLKIVVAKRSDEDEFLAGNWHIPGKIMLTTDNNFEDTIERTLKTELPGSRLLSKPVKFDCSYQSTLRGKEHAVSYWVIVDKLPEQSDNIDETIAVTIDNLPGPFLEEQIERIPRAYEEAKNYITKEK